VLISDVRDVSFQTPLLARPAPELEFPSEAPWPTIGACPWNSQWVEGCFGRPALDRLADKYILCADRHPHLADPIQQTFAKRRAASARSLRRARKRLGNAWKRRYLASWFRRRALAR